MITTISDQTKTWLTLSLIPGIGLSTMRAIHHKGWDGSFQRLKELGPEIPRLGKAISKHTLWGEIKDEAERQLKMATRYGVSIISIFDESYPKILATSKYDPFIIYTRGQLFNDSEKAIAVVGTRKPTKHGKDQATDIGRQCVENGYSVVSGLALGCDALAHKAALAAKGHTVAVMAHGLHTVAPESHRELAREIIDGGGALISTYHMGVDPEPHFFVQRDGVQAALAQGVIVVQSDINGGSLHAARAAIQDGRWIYAPEPGQIDQDEDEAAIQAPEVIRDGTEEGRAALLRIKSGEFQHLIKKDGELPFTLKKTTEIIPVISNTDTTKRPSGAVR